jgi:hypothetical protein
LYKKTPAVLPGLFKMHLFKDYLVTVIFTVFIPSVVVTLTK